jgi:hypothetical protein
MNRPELIEMKRLPHRIIRFPCPKKGKQKEEAIK